MDTSQLSRVGIHVYPEKVTYVFEGMTKQPEVDLTGFIYENRLYVPMHFFSEVVGQKIYWEPITYTVKAQITGTDNMLSSVAVGAKDVESTKTTPTLLVTLATTPKPTTSSTLVSTEVVSSGSSAGDKPGGSGGGS